VPNRRLALLLLLAGLFWPVSAAAAATLGVSPTRLELDPGKPAAALTVTNSGEAPLLLQVETFAWRAGTATSELEPTRAILAVPPMVELAPGERAVIRVARRASTTPEVEETYRVLVSEVPREEPGVGGVRLALRMSLPVFVTPPGARAEPRWSIERGAGGPSLVVVNEGRAHLHVRRLELVGPGRPIPLGDGPVYVLAGREHRWSLAGARLEGVRALSVRAETNLGELDLEIPARGG
jgi:fimbrial chaperone protein